MSYPVHQNSEELEVALAAALRRLAGASDRLGVLLVATPGRVAAVRSEAAVLALGALCHRRVERDDVVAGRARCSKPPRSGERASATELLTSSTQNR